jgi:hypothetical protein
MDNTRTTVAATLDQADDDILVNTVSDEALEAAAATERGQLVTAFGTSVCRDCF